MTIMTALLALILLSLTTTMTSAAASNNYNAYQYDMTTPQFTPDGRLLQVEYASRASDHSIFGMVAYRNSNNTHMMVSCPRMVTFYDTILIGWTGVLADTVSLLRHVYDHDDAHVRMYGTRLTAKQVAMAVAAKCQEHSFGGGLRPFGATLWVVDSTSLLIYQTDPSGRVLTLRRNEEQVHVAGGSQPNKVKEKLESCVLLPDLPLSEALPTFVHALLDTISESDVRRPMMELAVVSDKLGVYRLTESQQVTVSQLAKERQENI